MAGKVKIDIIGDAASALRAFKDAATGANQLGRETDKVSAGFGRARIAGIRLRAGTSFGPIAAGLVVGAQAARELSDDLKTTGDAAFTTQGRLKNLASELLTGNIIGGLKALEVQPLGKSWEDAQASLTKYINSSKELEVPHSLRDELDILSQLVGYDAKLNRLTNSFEKLWAAAHPPATLRGGLTMNTFGIDILDPTEHPAEAGLSQRLQTAISGADAAGGVRNEVAQRRRALETLKKQLGQGNLTDVDRETINRSIISLNSEIKTLLEKKKDDVVKTLVVISDALKLQEADARMSGSSSRLKAVLLREAQEIKQHLGRKLEPGDRVQLKEALLSVTDEVKSINKAAADALQQTADDLKSAALDKLSLLGQHRTAKREIEDATAAMKLARQLGGPEGIKLARRDLEDARLDKQRALLESAKVTGGKGGTTLHIGNINLPAVTNVRQLLDELQKMASKNTSQSRGRMPGHHLGLT